MANSPYFPKQNKSRAKKPTVPAARHIPAVLGWTSKLTQPGVAGFMPWQKKWRKKWGITNLTTNSL